MSSSDDENTSLVTLSKPENIAQHLKTQSQQTYQSSNNNLQSAFKLAKRAHKIHPSLDGLSELITSFSILIAAQTPISPTLPDYYKILDLERFSPISSIKKQYRKLALTLHPDKSPFIASEDAFKVVADAVAVLSDKGKRKQYDTKVRMVMQAETEIETFVAKDTNSMMFSGSCLNCGEVYKFDRKYLGFDLVCVGCKKSFKAVEVDGSRGNGAESGVKRKTSSAGSGNGDVLVYRRMGKVVGVDKGGVFDSCKSDLVNETRFRGDEVKEVESSDGVGIVESERDEVGEEETMTLAQIQKLAKKKVKEKEFNKSLKMKGKEHVEEEEMDDVDWEIEEEDSEEENEAEDSEKENEAVIVSEKRNVRSDPNSRSSRIVKRKMKSIMDLVDERPNTSRNGGQDLLLVDGERGIEKRSERLKNKKMVKGSEKHNLEEKERENEIVNTREKRERRRVSKYNNLEIVKDITPNNDVDQDIEKLESLRRDNLEVMQVEDSDFYDFDKDRTEKCFKKGQVWAIYDDKDGMPRHYALVDKVAPVGSFQVMLSWLEFQSSGGRELISRENSGFQMSCGRFCVTRTATVKHLNLFSHIVDCERVAREAYVIYPKKGTVWALYNDKTLDVEGRNQAIKDKQCYDIVVCLSSYSDTYGTSIAFLEKVDGFRTIFKRKEIGAHAVTLFRKDDMKRFSHRIPAKKLSGEEASGLPKDCWDLDPGSLSLQ